MSPPPTSHRLGRASVAVLSTTHPRIRLLVPCLLLILSAAAYVRLIAVSPPSDGNPLLFLPVWGVCFIPYFLACAYVVATKPLTGRRRWIEVGIILSGALLFRVILLPLPPSLSRDVWRYLWDARVVVHGYSPYVYAPGDKVLEPLRDILFANCRFRNIATDYPPGAELIFVLGYLLDPRSLAGIKTLFMSFDMITCIVLSRLLFCRGLDPRAVVIYAWCPLPIVEFAIQGHVDVLTNTFMVLSLLAAAGNGRRARVLTGFFIAMATLTRLYPLLLLPLLIRNRDRSLPLAFMTTVFLGYLPFIILGHGQVAGSLPAYLSQQGGNAGIVQQAVRLVSAALRLASTSTIMLEYTFDLVVVTALMVCVLTLHSRHRISIEMATLLIIGAILTVSSHVFPWYLTALLPWIPFLLRPLRASRESVLRGVAAATAWYVACTAFLAYIDNAVGVNTAPRWVAIGLVHSGIVMKVGVVAGVLLVYAFASLPVLRNASSSVEPE